MPDVDSIPFRKADGSGHYKSKQLPNDSGEFLEMLGLPSVAGDVSGPGASTTGQVAIFDDNTGTRLNTTSITGLATLTTGVLGSTPRPTGDIVGTTDAQTLTNKTLVNPVISGLTGLTKADVGLGNVDNTSDATKNSAVATLTNKTLTAPVINSPTGLVKADVGLGNVDNTSDANKPISSAQATVNTAKEDKANKGVNSGYASLDSGGKVPLAQIPDSVVGASQYQGTWNAATNSPAIPAAAIGNKGWYYSVSVAGTTNINGITSWAVGDQIISNGSVWQKIPNSDAVNSVNGQTGVVVLTKSDVGLSNVDNTSDANKPISTATSTALAGKEATANKGIASGYASLDATGKVPTAQLPAAALLSGDVVGPASSVAAEIASYADTTGKLLARITPPAGALVGTTATQTLSAKTLTAPTINNAVMTTPTGITKSDVGLANVDNTSDATKNAAAVTLTNKTINGANNTLTVRLDADVTNNLPTSRLNSGTGANSGSFWRGDGQWAPPAGGGDMVGPAASVDGELVVFNSTTGKVVKRPTQATGFVKHTLNGAAVTQTQMASGDIANGAVGATQLGANSVTNTHPNVTMITGQTEKTAVVGPDDVFLQIDNATGLYRKVKAKWFSKLARNSIVGLKVGNNVTDAVNDIDVTAGECRSDDNTADIVLSGAITKRLDAAWAAGTNQGGLDTGTIANTTYHTFAICNLTTGAVDVVFSASLSSPTMPSGFTVKRRIGSFVRVAGANTVFRFLGDYVQFVNPMIDCNDAQPTIGQVFGATFGLVPTGMKLLVHSNWRGYSTGGVVVFRMWDIDLAAIAICELWCTTAGQSNSVQASIWTNTSSGINCQHATGTNQGHLFGQALGYWDPRGKED